MRCWPFTHCMHPATQPDPKCQAEVKAVIYIRRCCKCGKED